VPTTWRARRSRECRLAPSGFFAGLASAMVAYLNFQRASLNGARRSDLALASERGWPARA